jgi:hypothetical protein
VAAEAEDEGGLDPPRYEVMYPDGHLARRKAKPEPGDPAMYWRERGQSDWLVIPLKTRARQQDQATGKTP